MDQKLVNQESREQARGSTWPVASDSLDPKDAGESPEDGPSRPWATRLRQGREWANGGLGSGPSLGSFQSGLSCQEFASSLAGGGDGGGKRRHGREVRTQS